MRRTRASSGGNAISLMGAASSSAGGAGRSNSTSVIVGGFDPRRRTELLAEARRKRVAWVEEARGVEEGVHGARRRRENEVAEIGRKAESELERLFPSAVRFHDFLSGLAGDSEESPGGDFSAILQPFMVQDVDIGNDRPIPSHREGADAYDVFLDKLRHPRAADVVKSLQQFVAVFKARAQGPRKGLTSPRGINTAEAAASVPRSGWGVEFTRSRRGLEVGASRGPRALGNGSDGGAGGVAGTEGRSGVTAATMSGMMHAFLGRVEGHMRESPLWRRETEAQWEETRECLERIVMHKVFDVAYGLAADSNRDEAISNRLLSLGFLTEEHLGVAPLVDTPGNDTAASWLDAEEQLIKMSSMRCPGDMLRCIIKCTRVVGNLLKGSAESGLLPGADEFLPALILLVKRANPPNVHSCLEFIQSFRDPSKLLSEAGYVLTQLVSAVCFLEEVDASLLSIAHTDFERGLSKFKKTAREGLQAHQLQARVKKEEEHARYLHRAVANQPSDSSSDTPAYAAAAAVATPATPAATSTAAAANGVETEETLPGPAALPEPGQPRIIDPGEVRAKRLAGLRNTQLLLGTASFNPATASSQDQQRQAAEEEGRTSLAETVGSIPLSGSSRLLSKQQQQQQQQQASSGREAQGGTAGEAGRLLGGHLRFVGCTASELRMSELPMLLAEHHQLARLCEELLAERGQSAGLILRRRRF